MKILNSVILLGLSGALVYGALSPDMGAGADAAAGLTRAVAAIAEKSKKPAFDGCFGNREMCVMMATGQTETSNAMLDLGYHQLAKEWGRAVSRILSAQIKNIVPMSSHTYKGIVFFKILTNNGLFCLFLSFPHHNSIKN